MKTIFFLLLLIALKVQSQTIFPLKISGNKRYFVTQQNKPFLYHGDTGWQIFTQLTTEEAIEYLAFRKSQGFNTIQVQIVMSPEQVNRNGQKPFHGDVDFSRPNDAYHDHVMKILQKADSLGLLIVMSQPWLGCCKEGFGNTPEKPIQKNGPQKIIFMESILARSFLNSRICFGLLVVIMIRKVIAKELSLLLKDFLQLRLNIN